MIQSMTGFGKAQTTLYSKKTTIEIRTLNSKNLDLNLKIPFLYKELESTIRKNISKKLFRGNIDVIISIDYLEKNNPNEINREVLKDYLNQLNKIHKGDINRYIEIAIKLPDVLKKNIKELNKDEKDNLFLLVERAVDKVFKYRINEGKSIEKDLIYNINFLENQLKKIDKIDTSRKEIINKKLRSLVSKTKTSQEIDENRLEQELIYYVEKYDINEEKKRLLNHISYFKKNLNYKVSNGKKLGFISQEIGREINTIGSKANHSKLQRIVVDMKDSLEKIKEQIQNVL